MDNFDVSGSCQGFLSDEKDKSKQLNLNWLRSVYEFTLLLDDVSRSIEPAWKLRELYLTRDGEKEITRQQINQARESLAKASRVL